MKSQVSTGALSADAESLYRRVLRGMPASLEEHAGELGWAAARAAARLDELIQLRLVRRGADGILRAEDPRASLGRLLDNEEAALDARRQQLLDLRSSIASFETDYRRGLQLSGPRVPPWEQIAPSEAPEVIEQLARNSRGPVLQASREFSAAHANSAVVRRLRESYGADGREQRTIFPLSVLADPLWHAYAERRAELGERQRYLDEVPVEFAVFGRTGVLLAEGESQDSGFLLIRPVKLIHTFVSLFESLWLRAEPVHEGEAAAQDLKLLELLALGFKDEAIARHLGMGLRTVRRRLSRMMIEHGADTRFQLGLAVARRGLLDETRTR